MDGTKCLCSIAVALLLQSDLARAGTRVSSTEILFERGTSVTTAPTSDGGRSITPPALWDTFVIDVKVRHRRVDDGGHKIDAAPESTTYTLERRRAGDQWTTTYILGPRDPQRVETPQGTTDLPPFLTIARIEVDAAGGRRFYDSRRREIALPSRDDLRKLLRHSEPGPPLQTPPEAAGEHPALNATGTGWLDNIVNPAAQRDERRRRLVQQYGTPSKYQALDRYLRVDGRLIRELLVEPTSALPVEINVLSDGVLQSHTTFEYSTASDGSNVRRGIHVEAMRQGAPGEREVVDVSFENLRFELRGGAQ